MLTSIFCVFSSFSIFGMSDWLFSLFFVVVVVVCLFPFCFLFFSPILFFGFVPLSFFFVLILLAFLVLFFYSLSILLSARPFCSYFFSFFFYLECVILTFLDCSKEEPSSVAWKWTRWGFFFFFLPFALWSLWWLLRLSELPRRGRGAASWPNKQIPIAQFKLDH